MAVPTRGAIAAWDLNRLREVGIAHETAAQRLREIVDGLRAGIYAIDDSEWGGDARLAAHSRVDSEEAEVKHLASAIESLGIVLGGAATDIEFAAGRMMSIAEWAEAGENPYAVSDDWVITDPAANPSAERVEQMKNWQADLISLGSGLELAVLTQARAIEGGRVSIAIESPAAAGFGPYGLGLLPGNVGREDLQKYVLAYEAAFGRPPATPEECSRHPDCSPNCPGPEGDTGATTTTTSSTHPPNGRRPRWCITSPPTSISSFRSGPMRPKT